MIALTLLAAGAVSWLLRVGFIVLVPAGRLPDRLRTTFTYAGPAALAAMLATALTHGAGTAAPVTPSPMLGATVAAGVVAWRTRRLGLTVVVGVGVLWILESLV